MGTDQTTLPKYVQTAELLIREIASGRLADGARLRPEREMAGDLGVSVGTLRKALDDLTEKGLLERVQGSGNYVRHRPESAGIYAFFRLELVDGGGLPTAELISVDRLGAPTGVSGLEGWTKAHRIRRLRRLSGRPAALEEIWLDGAMAETVLPNELSESLYLYYRERLGLWISGAEDRIGLDRVPPWCVPPFAPAPGDPVGYIERWSRTEDGRVAEYSRTWFDTNVARYIARLK